MYTPLLTAVERYSQNKMRFHMPGHKGDMAHSLYGASAYDVTELEFTDNLLVADSVIRESEELTARDYGVARTLYYTTGATTAIYGMLRAVKGKCSKVGVFRTAHRSVWNALLLQGMEPVILDIDYNEDGLPVMPSAIEIADFVRRSELECMVVVTPDYYGRVLDLKGLRALLPDTLILADSAHGAHFAYSGLLPEGAERYADMTVMGAHKTLPVYTGGAYLQVRSEELVESAERARRLYHTTSPSYLVMCSMDYSGALYRERGEVLYRQLVEKIRALPFGDRIERTDDPTRILIRCDSGERLYRYLADRGIYCECYTSRHVVLIATPFDLGKLDRIDLTGFVDGEEDIPVARRIVTERAVDFVETMDRERERVSLYEAVGRVAGAQVGLYPPGCPVIIEGEVYTDEIIDYLDKNRDLLYGLENGEAVVLRGV